MSGALAAQILQVSLVTAQLLLAVAIGIACYRVMCGPRAEDRILGLDTLYVNAMQVLVLFGIRSGATLYFETALIIGMLGFVGTVALSKFLMRGEVIE